MKAHALIVAATGCLLAGFALAPSAVLAAKDPAPGFLEQALDLPGMPAAVIPTDMTGDGLDDLVVLVAYTTWDSVSKTEQVTFDDIEGLVEVMSVVSALLDRRELRVYPALVDGGFGNHFTPLELDTSMHALEAVHDGSLIAVTDEGVSTLRLIDGIDGPHLEMNPVLDLVTTFTDSGAFYSELRLLHDLTGDGIEEIVLPTTEGWSVHRGTADGFEPDPIATLTAPQPKPEDEDEDEDEDLDDGNANEDPTESESDHHADEADGEKEIRVGAVDEDDLPRRPRIRIPEARDVNGDQRPDLMLLSGGRRIGPIVYLNRGSSFSPAVELELDEETGREEEITFIGDLDGDGRAELVSQEELDLDDDAGFREEMQQAKRPVFTYRFYEIGSDLSVAASPFRTFRAIGYTFHGSDEHDDEVDIRLPGGFQDLDGDGREDVVAISLEFSLVPLIFQALITQSISLRMDFHPWCQQENGGFSEVPDLDLSGKFRIKFRNVQIKHLSQFAGDFNGDGRKDFIQLGRGKKVTIHQGGPRCSYPLKPDRKLRFEREPKHLGLVRILDLDGNGHSDIYVVHPLRDPKDGASIPVRLDLYLGESIE